MKQLIKKFASRKFIAAFVSTICGILGMCNVADNTIGFVGSILMIIVPNVVYIITEGTIDREGVKNMLEDIVDVFEDTDDSATNNS